MNASMISSTEQSAPPELESLPSEAASPIEEVKAFIRRFVFIRDESIYELLALWVVCTYLHAEFEFVPYVFVHSPEKQSGKTRLLEVLDLLVANSSGIQTSPTEAVLFRTAKGKTQLLDEADGWQNLSSIRSVLNSGFQRNGRVTRMVQDSNGGWKDVEFPVFGPKAIAGIGNRILGDTLSDRVYAIELLRQTPSERREKLRWAKVEPESRALKEKIQRWANENRGALRESYAKHEDLPYLSGFRDRTEDISEPLAAILERIYRDDVPELKQARARFRAAVAATRFENDDTEEEHGVLSALLGHMGDNQQLRVQPFQVVQWCPSMPEMDEYRVGEILRKYGFESKSVRIKGQPKKAYVVPRSRLEELVKRFVQDSALPRGEDKEQ